MTGHEPHIGDIYASNDKRDIASGHLQRRRITAVHANHVCFDGGTRGITRRVLDTTVQRGYRLVRCAGNDQTAPERTYTRADMARAWENGHSWGWNDAKTKAWAERGPDIGSREAWRLRTPNPHEQENA